MNGIEDRHWKIWAMLSRQTPGYEVGYPHQEPWYIPQGPWREHGERDELGQINPEDEALAEAIGQAVIQLGKIRPKQRLALIAWWRAYPGASGTVERNCRRLCVSRQYVYEIRDNARSWCEALIEFTAANSARRQIA